MASSLIVITLFLPSLIAAFQLFPSDTASGYPAACGAVLSQNITSCNNLVEVIDPYATYDQTTLDQSCLEPCTSELTDWYSQAFSSCSGMTYDTDEGFVAPLSDVIGNILFNFNQTCLQVDGQYCNIILGYELGNSTDNSTTITSTNDTADCNLCNLYRLRDTAQSPYGDGPLVYSESLYQSFTSSCGDSFTGYPLTTSVPPPTPTS